MRRGQRADPGGHPGDDRGGPALTTGDRIDLPRPSSLMTRSNWQIVLVRCDARHGDRRRHTRRAAQSPSQPRVEISANVGRADRREARSRNQTAIPSNGGENADGHRRSRRRRPRSGSTSAPRVRIVPGSGWACSTAHGRHEAERLDHGGHSLTRSCSTLRGTVEGSIDRRRAQRTERARGSDVRCRSVPWTSRSWADRRSST